MPESDFTISAATVDDAHELAPDMREEDVREVMASGALSPLEALVDSLLCSRVAFTLRIKGKAAAIFGIVCGDGVEKGVVWILTGNAVAGHRKSFVRWSRPFLELLLSECPSLHNFVDARYEGALRWARWLGFHVEPAIPFGPEQLPFHPISIRSHSHV